MSFPEDKPRKWATLTITLAADTEPELDDALDELADAAFWGGCVGAGRRMRQPGRFPVAVSLCLLSGNTMTRSPSPIRTRGFTLCVRRHVRVGRFILPYREISRRLVSKGGRRLR